MSKRVLVIDSGASDRRTMGLVLKEWSRSGTHIELWTSNPYLKSLARDESWDCVSWSQCNTISISVYLRASWLKLRLWKKSWTLRYNAVILLQWPEKVLFSKIAHRLADKLFWFELTDLRLDKLRPAWQTKLRRLSSLAKVLTANHELSVSLENFGYHQLSLRLMPYCILPGLVQVDLFQNLARHFKLRKDYFTIGAVVDWSDAVVAESLIKCLKLCLDVSPYFQVVLLGDGPAREQIKWLVKRWHLETSVWLVGEQTQPEKWLEGFQIFIMATKRPGWDDLAIGATAISRSIYTVGQLGSICEDLITGPYGKIVDISDSQALAIDCLQVFNDDNIKRELPYLSKTVAKDFVALDKLAEKLLTMI